LAVWMSTLTVTLLVPLGWQHHRFELIMDALAVAGASLSVLLGGIDDDRWKLVVGGGVFFLTWLWAFVHGQSTLANMKRIVQQLTPCGAALVTVGAVVLVVVSALLWFLPEWQGRAAHASWHLTTAWVAVLLLYYAREPSENKGISFNELSSEP